jgi:hypothetical protein
LECQPAAAVFCNDVFDDGAGFRQHHIAIGDDGRRSDSMQRFIVRRRQHGLGIPRVALQLVGNLQLLAEPDDALGLRLAEMMDGKHGWPLTRHMRQAWRSALFIP